MNREVVVYEFTGGLLLAFPVRSFRISRFVSNGQTSACCTNLSVHSKARALNPTLSLSEYMLNYVYIYILVEIEMCVLVGATNALAQIILCQEEASSKAAAWWPAARLLRIHPVAFRV